MKWVETPIGEGPDLGLARSVRSWDPPFPAPRWQRILEPFCSGSPLRAELLRRRPPLLETFPRPVLEPGDLRVEPASADEVVDLLQQVVREVLRAALLERLDRLLASEVEIPVPPVPEPARQRSDSPFAPTSRGRQFAPFDGLEVGADGGRQPLWRSEARSPLGFLAEGIGALLSPDGIERNLEALQRLLKDDPEFQKVRFESRQFADVVRTVMSEHPMPDGEPDDPQLQDWRKEVYDEALPSLVDGRLRQELGRILSKRMSETLSREGLGGRVLGACMVAEALLRDFDETGECRSNVVWQLLFDCQMKELG